MEDLMLMVVVGGWVLYCSVVNVFIVLVILV